MNCGIAIVLLLLKFATSSNNIPDDFPFNGYLKLGGMAELSSNGLITLTNSTKQPNVNAFYNFPIQFKNASNASAISFSTTFIFATIADYPTLGAHGLVFVISPNKEIPGIKTTNDGGNDTNHIVAVKFDSTFSPEFHEINDNHVDINVNGLDLVESAPAGYFEDQNGAFRNLSLINGDPMQVWVEYDGINRQLKVTMSPINIPKPQHPLLSMTKDLSPILLEYMYVGFSSSTGSNFTSHYILGWSFKMNGKAKQIDTYPLLKLFENQQERDDKVQDRILLFSIPTLLFLELLLPIYVVWALIRMEKYIEVHEDWEVQYGPLRFGYQELFIATKGFKGAQLLGRGGFGRVYRGVLPQSNIQVAVKRAAHYSRQGLREFVAEIATIGRLRHPNLVRLLGYCRTRQELLLVYDYMPNGSLDRFLYGQPNGTLNWMQRFKIIKDVASGLFYLHQQWVQVIIHRDIKASNVLIDYEFNGRLGDFGLAKLWDHGTDPQTSHVAGTLGYIAPELERSGKASTSTDLFAFGTFMLEVVCGRRPIEPRSSPERVILIEWVFECLERGNIPEAIDRRLGTEYAVEEAELVLKLGLLCSHAIAAARPSMATAVQYLEGRAQLPDNLGDIIKSRDFGGASNEEDVIPTSIPSLTNSEPFTSRGR